MPVITDTFLKAMKPPAAGRIEIKDDRCAGLEVSANQGGCRIVEPALPRSPNR